MCQSMFLNWEYSGKNPIYRVDTVIKGIPNFKNMNKINADSEKQSKEYIQ